MAEMLSAQARQVADSCGGNSGGPLTIDRGRGYTELVGIVSWGVGYYYGCGEMGVYANVAEPDNSSFINNIVFRSVGFPVGVVSLTEGESIQVKVQRETVDQPVTLDYRIDAVGADTEGGFSLSSFTTPLSGRLTFPRGASEAAIPVSVLQNARQQGARLFRITLSNLTAGWSLGADTLDLWVEDRIREVGFRDSEVRMKEGNSIEVPVERLAVSRPVTLNYRIEPIGTPSAGAFGLSSFATPVSGQLTIAPGATTAGIPLQVRQDSQEQRAQAFVIILSNPSAGWTFGRWRTTLRVEDSVFSSVGFRTRDVTLKEGESTEVLVERLNVNQHLNVEYLIETIGAPVAGGFNLQYFATPTWNRLTMAQGVATASIPLHVIENSQVQPAQLFRITLRNAVPETWRFGPIQEVKLRVEDSIQTVGFRGGDITVKEGVRIQVPVERTSVTQPVTLDYRIEPIGTPAAGGFSLSSFATPVSGQLTIAPGATTASIPLQVRQDSQEQSAQSFAIILSNPSPGWAIGRNQAVKLVVEDSVQRIGFRTSDVAMKEGERIQVQVDRTSVNQPVTFNYKIQTIGTPAAGGFSLSSFTTPVSGRLTIAPGSTTASIPLQVRQEGEEQLAQSFRISLLNISPGWGLGRNQEIKLQVEDSLPRVGFRGSGVELKEGERIDVKVERLNVNQPVTLNYRIETIGTPNGGFNLSSFTTPVMGRRRWRGGPQPPAYRCRSVRTLKDKAFSNSGSSFQTRRRAGPSAPCRRWMSWSSTRSRTITRLALARVSYSQCLKERRLHSFSVATPPTKP